MCVFGARNNKSNDQDLLMIAQLPGECEIEQDERFGTCRQCAVRRELGNTDIFQHTSLRKTCMDRFLVMFKDTRSMSSHEMARLNRIPAILRQ